MTTPQSAEVVFLFRLEDQASAGMARTERAIDDVTEATERQRKSFNVNAVAALQLTGSLLIMSGAAIRIGKSLGLFNKEQAETISNILLFAGAASSFISAILQIRKALIAMGVVQAFVKVLSNPIGGAIAIGLAAAAAGIVAGKLAGYQTLPGQIRTVGGASGQGQLAIVHGGEQIGRPLGGSGVTVNINGGIFTNDSSVRQLARVVSEKIREENRTRGTTV